MRYAHPVVLEAGKQHSNWTGHDVSAPVSSYSVAHILRCFMVVGAHFVIYSCVCECVCVRVCGHPMPYECNDTKTTIKQKERNREKKVPENTTKTAVWSMQFILHVGYNLTCANGR